MCITDRQIATLGSPTDRSIDQATFARLAHHAADCKRCRRRVSEAVTRDTVERLVPFLAFVMEVVFGAVPMPAKVSMAAGYLGTTIDFMAAEFLGAAPQTRADLLARAVDIMRAHFSDNEQGKEQEPS